MFSMLDLTTRTKKKNKYKCVIERVMSACSLHAHSENWHGLYCSFISLACAMTCSFLWLSWLSWFVLIHSGILCHIPAPRFLPVCEYLWNQWRVLPFNDSYIIQGVLHVFFMTKFCWCRFNESQAFRIQHVECVQRTSLYTFDMYMYLHENSKKIPLWTRYAIIIGFINRKPHQ